MKNKNVEKIAVSAVLLALSVALSFVIIYKLPYGGSITLLSMLPICFISIKYGVGWGLAGGFLLATVNFLQDGLANVGYLKEPGDAAICVLFDYFIAFTVLGLAGMFRRNGYYGQISGIVAVVLMRYACHVVSGATIWGQWAWEIVIDGEVQPMPPLLYSLAYNSLYMLPELILTVAGATILLKSPVVKKFFAPGSQLIVNNE